MEEGKAHVELSRTRTPRRRASRLLWLMALLLAASAAGAAYIAWERMQPSTETVQPQYRYTHPIRYNGELLDAGARMEDETILLPMTVVPEVLGADVPIRYEADSGTVILTTADKVMRLKTDALTATVNEAPFDLAVAATVEDDEVYLPLAPLSELYGLVAERSDSGIVTLLRPGQAISRAVAQGDEAAPVRTEPSIFAPIADRVAPGTEVRIWGEAAGERERFWDKPAGWYLIQTPAGHVGYADKSGFSIADAEVVPEPVRAEPFIPWPPDGRKINLTWEAVYSVPADPKKIGDMPGVNVVSPTWFEVMDDEGTIRSKADPNYVAWAHKRGYQVWALWSNSFEPDRTTKVLATYETRLNMIKQLLSYAQIYKLQGINIDFENVHTKDKENLVQFVREFTPLAHEQGLVVSIDVTPKSNSEMWSAFLDRRALGQVVDYMMVMTYDEHWASSPKSGSVASLPWVERSITRILEEDDVPARKLVLGIPLYTRVWTETKAEDGSVKVSSKALGMQAVEKLIQDRKLKPVYEAESGQHYVEYTSEDGRHRIWIEDETSIEARAALVKKYDLGGVATWQRGFQKPAIWQTLHDALSIRP